MLARCFCFSYATFVVEIAGFKPATFLHLRGLLSEKIPGSRGENPITNPAAIASIAADGCASIWRRRNGGGLVGNAARLCFGTSDGFWYYSADEGATRTLSASSMPGGTVASVIVGLGSNYG
jgi:hypothetical protein